MCVKSGIWLEHTDTKLTRLELGASRKITFYYLIFNTHGGGGSGILKCLGTEGYLGDTNHFN
jgi:hypothetical protein